MVNVLTPVRMSSLIAGDADGAIAGEIPAVEATLSGTDHPLVQGRESRKAGANDTQADLARGAVCVADEAVF